MAEDSKPLELPNQTSCFTLKEIDEVKAYKEAGLPGVIDITDEKLMSAFDMMLNGMRFLEISKTLGLKKVQVMYLADKYDWHSRRLEFLDEFEMHMKNRIVEQKIRSQGFLMKAMHVFERRMGKKMSKYLSTGDESIGDTIDFKEVSSYVKMVETLKDLDAGGVAKDPKGNPLVGINAGPDGVNMKLLADNSIEITPRQKSHAQMLAELANAKRDQNKDKK